MQIEIKHCNNIDSAPITIDDGKLNIKFGPNGTGKTTIAKALQLSLAEDDSDLSELMPFKYRELNPDNKQPQVIGTDNIGTVMCFNEDYVNQFTFKSDELISNSFDIFIRSDAYKAVEQEISSLMTTIKQTFTSNPELETLLSNLKELGGAFKLTKTGVSKSSPGMKGLSGGNKLEHIPPNLEPYKPFIQSSNSVNWIDWQTKGHKQFSSLSDSCPFCSLDSSDKKDQIEQVSLEYDRNVIKNLIKIISIIEKLGEYFSEDARNKLAIICTLENGMESEHEAFIVNVKKQIDNFIEKLEHLKTLSASHFKSGEEVKEKLPSYKLDLKFFGELNSDKTKEALASINSSIDELSKKAGLLQGKISVQRIEMQRLIEKHQNDINGFLAYAGYRYKVEIAGNEGQSQLKLLHVDYNQHLSGGNQHLSFGERNAFAIVLFMYECLSKKPSLIILDDPISSFDKNKKFAILEMLFRRDSNSCLKGKTVLMLTHDVEPIIDTLKSVRKQFNNQVKASYLRLSNGQITEKAINQFDIKTFAQICISMINAESTNAIIRLIYLRRYHEVLDDNGDAYQVLSNLFHKREIPIDNREPRQEENEAYPQMDNNKFLNGCSKIKEYIEPFDYTSTLAEISSQDNLKALYQSCQNGYEKLQVFRLLVEEVESSVIKKFVNETYHIENEFIYQLNPAEFDLIPEYVIKECDNYL
jgi:energy-coupling factor transporter ATP-binding protein EcfA2